MAEAVTVAQLRGEYRSRASVGWNVQLALDLIGPALLLGLLRVWTWAMAPKQGFYFTAESVLIMYAYFSVVRTVHLYVHSLDSTGRYSRSRALDARGSFYGELSRRWKGIALATVSILVPALAVDALTADTGFQLRLNLHLSVLFVELMVWARYGAAVVLASARWSPTRSPDFALARRLAWGLPVASSFAFVNVGFAAAALAAVAAYKWIGAGLPTMQAEISCLAVVCVGLAWLALWLHCRWAVYALTRLDACRVQ